MGLQDKRSQDTSAKVLVRPCMGMDGRTSGVFNLDATVVNSFRYFSMAFSLDSLPSLFHASLSIDVRFDSIRFDSLID